MVTMGGSVFGTDVAGGAKTEYPPTVRLDLDRFQFK